MYTFKISVSFFEHRNVTIFYLTVNLKYISSFFKFYVIKIMSSNKISA